jgi:membrane associated rhomboid family serine protease
LLPVFDDNPGVRRPVITWVIAVLCSLLFLFQVTFLRGQIPAADAMTGTPPWMPLGLVCSVFNLFVHADFWHIAGNMLYLLIFGNNIEDLYGRARYVGFYVLCGLAGTVCHWLVNPEQTVVGASGAISGVMGAYMVAHPDARIHSMLGPIKVKLKAVTWILIYVAMNIAGVAFLTDGTTSFIAHLGGIATGTLLTWIWLSNRRQSA